MEVVLISIITGASHMFLYNIHDLNDCVKCKVIRTFLISNKVDLVCLQETKIHDMGVGVVRS